MTDTEIKPYSLADKILIYSVEHPGSSVADIIRGLSLGINPESPDEVTTSLVEHVLAGAGGTKTATETEPAEDRSCCWGTEPCKHAPRADQVVAVITYDDDQAHVTVMDTNAGSLFNEHYLPADAVQSAVRSFVIDLDRWVK